MLCWAERDQVCECKHVALSPSPQQRHRTLWLLQVRLSSQVLNCDTEDLNEFPSPCSVLSSRRARQVLRGAEKQRRGKGRQGKGMTRERPAPLSAQALGACQPLQQVQTQGQSDMLRPSGVSSLNRHRLLAFTPSTLWTVIDHRLSRGENRVHRGDSVVPGRSRHRKGGPRRAC